MPLPRRTKSLDGIKEAHRDLYTPKKVKENGADVEIFVLSDIDNHDDVDIVRTLRGDAAKDRVKYAAIEAKLAALPEGVDAEKVVQLIAENEALKAEKEALTTKDQKLIDTAVEKKLLSVTSGLQLKINNYEKEVGTLRTENEKLTTAKKTRTIDDEAIGAFTAAGVEKHVYARNPSDPDDEPDGLSWARRVAVIGDDGRVLHKASGLPLKDVLTQMRDDGQRPHWFAGSAGTGSGGSGPGGSNGGSNPWSAEAWDAEKQSEIQMKDSSRAEALARQAGVGVNEPFHPKNGLPKFFNY